MHQNICVFIINLLLIVYFISCEMVSNLSYYNCFIKIIAKNCVMEIQIKLVNIRLVFSSISIIQ